MYELFEFLLVGSLGGIGTLKMSRAGYVLYKLDERISNYVVNVMFQYFVIYFNRVIQHNI